MTPLGFCYSAAAEDDLLAIYHFIAMRDSKAAERVLDKMDEKARLLTIMPNLGQARDDIRKGLRHIVVGNYLILYKIEKDRILIVRIIHGRRNIPSLLT
jgi:toxin ParE1/3/4